LYATTSRFMATSSRSSPSIASTSNLHEALAVGIDLMQRNFKPLSDLLRFPGVVVLVVDLGMIF
jgi:hypothetical protein